MIKINLARGIAQTPSAAIGAANIPSTDSFGSESRGSAFLNLGLMVLATIGVYFYVSSSRSKAEDELKALQAEFSGLQVKKTEQETKSDSLTSTVKQNEDMDRNLLAMQSIGESRFTAIKVIDSLQTLMPSKTWLKAIEMKGAELKIEGYSLNSTGMSSLFSALDQSVFFSRVKIVNQSQESKDHDKIQKFELSCIVGEEK